ncbi:unnamed protein product [Prorocentrum cordatum]|uniref:Uncharacterized protein n=1 Tax=Prorocentrum cordatum TaxID=2364126 RepID=A0ABN9Y1Y4_9DINO|nr:unnamed protein product [Polarella glacialis]
MPTPRSRTRSRRTSDCSLLSEIQQLAIFPLAGTEVDFVTLTHLHAAPCEGIPLEWQVPLVHVLNPAVRLSEGASRLLHMLGVQPAQESALEVLAVQRLLSVEAGHGEPDAGDWAALSVLRRCFVAGREPGAPWGELRDALLLPAASGGWLPAERLRPWSFLGVAPQLPQGVIGHVRAFAGLERALVRALPGAALERKCVKRPPPSLESGGFGVVSCARQDWNLGWEVFLCGVGCAPLDPAERFAEEAVEVTLELGGLLSSGEYWANAVASPRVLGYLEELLGPGAPQLRRAWARQLPVVRSRHPPQMPGRQRLLALQDIFAREPFHEIAGDLLEYVGAPADPRVLRLLEGLGVSTEVNRESLLKCLRQLKRISAQDISVFADVYRKLGDIGLQSLGEEELVFVPGRGCLHAEDCTWLPFRVPLLQRCCRAEALSDLYGRFGAGAADALQRWVRERPDSSAVELCDALHQAVRCANPGQECPNPRPVQESEALEQLFDASVAVVRALAVLCCDEGSGEARRHATVAFEWFTASRLIVLPNPPGGCRVLHVGEAFWSVHPSLQRQAFAELALENHYADPLMYRFFVDVLRVRQELTLQQCMLITVQEQQGNLDRGPGELTEGIGSLQVDVGEMDGAGSRPFDVDAAVCRSYQRAQFCAHQHGDWLDEGDRQPAPPQTRQPPQPRRWHRAAEALGIPVYVADGHTLPEDFNPGWFGMLRDLCPAFGLRPEQIALAYDASGRCVSEGQLLLLDYGRGRRLAQLAHQQGRPLHPDSVLSLWLSELAHALAHLGTGPAHDEAFLRVQAELLAAAAPAARHAARHLWEAAGVPPGAPLGGPSGGCRGGAAYSLGAAAGPSAMDWPPQVVAQAGPPPGQGPTPHSSASAPSGQPAQRAAQPRPVAGARSAAPAAPRGGRGRGRGAKGGSW